MAKSMPNAAGMNVTGKSRRVVCGLAQLWHDPLIKISNMPKSKKNAEKIPPLPIDKPATYENKTKVGEVNRHYIE